MTSHRLGVHVGSAFDLGVDSADIRRFYRTHWQRPVALGESAFYRWQFVDAPDNGGRDMVCCAVADGRLVGVMGLNRRPVVLDGRGHEAAELTTWVVDAEARGSGAGRAMLAYLKDTYDVLFGMGISDEGLRVYQTSGFQFVRAIPRFFRIYDPAAAREYARIDTLGERMLARRQQWSGPRPSVVEIRPSEIGALGWPEGMMYARENRHLEWRFERHPVFSYRAFRGTDGGRSGAAVVRMDGAPDFRLLHVLEISGDPMVASGVIEAAASEMGAHAVDFYCTHTQVTAPLRALGWFSGSDDLAIRLLHLFHPPEYREPQTTSLIFWAKPDLMQAACDTGRLYMTKSDLDLDRPTLHYYESAGVARDRDSRGSER